jgi:hypothetical protein
VELGVYWGVVCAFSTPCKRLTSFPIALKVEPVEEARFIRAFVADRPS